MEPTATRLLRLLSLLQRRREWTGQELAARLEVSGRTVRHDIQRLRGLGYPVDATRGAAGGYPAGVGAAPGAPPRGPGGPPWVPGRGAHGRETRATFAGGRATATSPRRSHVPAPR